LFGLSSLTIYQRKKEIGIRKVIGANFRSIFVLFSKEYLLLIVIALIVISPVSWFVMERWLETFTYKAGLQIYLFLTVGAVIVGLSLITILLSILKISGSRPADLMGE
jgi:putative ABC transport system permease protein